MFGVDISELMVIMVVALIVIGPERLPKVARTLGFLWGRAQRYVNGIKADIARDMAIDEFRQLTERVQQEARMAEQAMSQVAQAIDQQVQQLDDSAERPVQTVVQAASSVPHPPPAVQQQTQQELQPPAEQHKFPVD
jgi:sec-independent protein translocase protein TatB